MRKIFCGTSGSAELPNMHKLSEIPVQAEVSRAFAAFYGADLSLRPAQDAALFSHKLLRSRENAIIATPTNSGKSLLACLLLFQEAAEGRTVILVEPLRSG